MQIGASSVMGRCGVNGEYAAVYEGNTHKLTFYKVKQAAAGHHVNLPANGASEEDIAYIKDLARDVIVATRAKLPYGAFNNRMTGAANFRRGGAGFMSNRIPRTMNALAEFVQGELSAPYIVDDGNVVEQQFVNMAARAAGSVIMKGGVCSLISHVALGELTTRATRVQAAIVYSNFDHSFMVIRRSNTPWYVVDAWVGTPYVCPWADCYFGADSIVAAWEVLVKEPTTHPYGVEFPAVDVVRVTREATTEYHGLSRVDAGRNYTTRPADEAHGGMTDHVWAQTDNLAEAARARYGEIAPAATPLTWG